MMWWLMDIAVLLICLIIYLRQHRSLSFLDNFLLLLAMLVSLIRIIKALRPLWAG